MNPVHPTRVLFLCWGYSVHARRRIEVFCTDPRFSVLVVSTHEYRFDGAETVVLRGAATPVPPPEQQAEWLPNDRPWSAMLRQLLEWEPALQREFATAAADFMVLAEAVERFAPQVVFVQTLVYPCFLAFLLPPDVPLAVTFWNGDVTWQARWWRLEEIFKQGMVQYGVQRADLITVNSDQALAGCRRRGAGKRTHLIRYPGVDLQRFFPADRTQARAALGLSDGPVVLCPRGLGGYFNSDVIVAAMPEVVRAVPDVLFLFTSGVGLQEWPEHQEQAAAAGVAGRLRHDGQVEWERMPLYYQAADVMVSISSCDSLPNCMLEAMACGTPVVMGDIPAIRDWVRDGRNGRLAPTRDPGRVAAAILAALGDENGDNERFRRLNLQTVRREVDSRRNAERVRELVRHTACTRRKRPSFSDWLDAFFRGPGRWPLWYETALHLFRRGDHAAAEHWFRLLACRPRSANPMVHYHLGRILEKTGRRGWRARLQRAVELWLEQREKSDAELYHLASACATLGQGRRAALWFRAVLGRSRNPALLGGAWFHLGELARLGGRRARARECYRRCLESIPAHRQAAARLQEEPAVARREAKSPARRTT